MQRRGKSLVGHTGDEDLTIVVLHIGDRERPLRVELEHCLRIRLIRNSDLGVRNAVQLQDFQSAMVDFHDRRKRVCAPAALYRNEDLLRGLMHDHVIDDDLVIRRAKKCGEFLVETPDEVTTFKIVEMPSSTSACDATSVDRSAKA
jgi:hypothetical protein